MKNKKLTYLLICCVAGIWGIIFYRIFMNTEDEDQNLSVGRPGKAVYFNMVDHHSDPVSLDLNYEDPFSGDFNTEDEKSEPELMSTVKPFAAPPLPKPQVNWSSVAYTGAVYNPKTRKTVAIISVNGKESMLEEGQSANGIKFIKRIGDSVKVEYQHTMRYLSIK